MYVYACIHIYMYTQGSRGCWKSHELSVGHMRRRIHAHVSYEEEDTCVGKVMNNLYLYQHLHIHTHTHTHTHTGQPVCVDVPDEGPREQLERRDCCPAT